MNVKSRKIKKLMIIKLQATVNKKEITFLNILIILMKNMKMIDNSNNNNIFWKIMKTMKVLNEQNSMMNTCI